MCTCAPNILNQVWSSDTGALLHTVKSAHAQSSRLIPHPNDPRLLASFGEEGTVCTWGVGRGRGGGGRLIQRVEKVLTAGPETQEIRRGMSVAVLDGIFSPNSNSVAVTNALSGLGGDGDGGVCFNALRFVFFSVVLCFGLRLFSIT